MSSLKILLEVTGYNLSDLPLVADKVADFMPNDGVVVFQGAMGAGKTTLIKEICKRLGVVDDVSSPTFGLVHVYHKNNGGIINHIDLYRLEDEREAEEAGIFNLFAQDGLSLIEWPEIIADYLPQSSLVLKVNICDNERLDKGEERRNIILLGN
ncbi:tRNA (adenosine(37)-N6)-threonylcarbamoyltransferase complex ATPase subunit type 1 TsaE [Flavobacteriales bacterium]|jgi:tRNA threonylcarbamoyladenosine biosynthesis protein TsaE|nr:tRNA (adenosine(37)-N6)-threonylcarbamoyltransferase complex ATPase subunit type 1 TsaE [Flavobacteriales bacterium]